MHQHRKAKRTTAQAQPRGQRPIASLGSATASDDGARIAKLCEANRQSILHILDVLYPDDPSNVSNYIQGIPDDHFARFYPHLATPDQRATQIAMEAVAWHRLGFPVSFSRLQAQFATGERPLASYCCRGDRMTLDEAIASSVVNMAAPLAEQVIAGGSFHASPARVAAMQLLASFDCNGTQEALFVTKERLKYAGKLAIGLLSHNRGAIDALASLLMAQSGRSFCSDANAVLEAEAWKEEEFYSLCKRTQLAVRRLIMEGAFHLDTDAFGAVH